MSQRSHLRSCPASSLRSVVAIVCVLLVLLVGAAQLLHSHGPDQAPDPGCSLCAVAHMSALPAPVLAAPVSTRTVVALRTPETGSAPRRHLLHHLYIRPPPVGNVKA